MTDLEELLRRAQERLRLRWPLPTKPRRWPPPLATDWRSRFYRWIDAVTDWIERHEDLVIAVSVMTCIVCILGVLGLFVLALVLE